MKFKRLVQIMGTLLGCLVGFVIGLIVGMQLGGNHFVNFTFNGVRGYEAVGQLGSIIGSLIGGFLGYGLFSIPFKKKQDK